MQTDLRLYFRGVDVEDITHKYLNGEYANLVSQGTVVITKPEEPVVSASQPAIRAQFEYYLTPTCKVAFIGYKPYESDGRYVITNPNKKYNCMYCLRKIEDKPLGIPIHREATVNKLYFHLIDVFCCFECTYAEYMSRRSNTIYSNSFGYLSEMYELITKKSRSTLHPASDRRLLEIFNGAVPWEEFHMLTTTYSTKPPYIYSLPVSESLDPDP